MKKVILNIYKYEWIFAFKEKSDFERSSSFKKNIIIAVTCAKVLFECVGFVLDLFKFVCK